MKYMQKTLKFFHSLSFDLIIFIDTIDQIEALEQVAIFVQLVSPMYLHPMLW